MAKNKITFEKFLDLTSQIEITLGTIEVVERVPKSNKMLRLEVNFGEGPLVQVLTNIGDKLQPIQLYNKQFPFVTNVEPAKIMGLDSFAVIVIPTAKNGSIDVSYIMPANGSTLL